MSFTALINFCTFHAAFVKPLGWRPTFKVSSVTVLKYLFSDKYEIENSQYFNVNSKYNFFSLSVLQRLVESFWLCTLRVHYVPDSLGFIFNNVHRHSGPVLGRGVPKTWCELGFNDTSSNLQIGTYFSLSIAANWRTRQELSPTNPGLSWNTTKPSASCRFSQFDYET